MTHNSDNPNYLSGLYISSTSTFIILFTTLVFIFIQALKSNDSYITNLFSLEICVLLIASYFYSKIMNEIDLSKVGLLRYFDWSLTTPILLLTFLLIIHHENKIPLNIWYYLGIVVLNYLMLYFGYLGETKVLEKTKSILFGFFFYIIMILIIYFKSVNINTKRNTYNIKLLFIVFTILWASYGFADLVDEKIKNYIYNNLDILSKCLFSIFIWVYYGSIFTY
jgi:bacteriorhodopsin